MGALLGPDTRRGWRGVQSTAGNTRVNSWWIAKLLASKVLSLRVPDGLGCARCRMAAAKPRGDDSTAGAGNPLFNIRAGARLGRAPKGGHADRLAGALAPRSAAFARAPGRARHARRAARVTLALRHVRRLRARPQHRDQAAARRARGLGRHAAFYRNTSAARVPVHRSDRIEPAASIGWRAAKRRRHAPRSAGCPLGLGLRCWYRQSSWS